MTESNPIPREYPSSLLTFPVGSHMFECLLKVSPLPVFSVLWKLYFEGKVGKLSIHPYANFVVAAGVARLDAHDLESAVQECQAINGGRSLISQFCPD